MPIDQNYFDQVVRTKRGPTRVRCRPRGGELRELTDSESVRWVQWLSVLPGVLGLVGLLLHHTVYRRQWEIEVEERSGDGVRATRWTESDRRHAEGTYDHLVAWIQSGQDVDSFRAAHARED